MSFCHPRDVHFQCQRCGLCCRDTETRTRHILLLGAEARRISKHTSKPIRGFAAQIEGSEPYGYEMKKTPEKGKCVFLNGNTCAIYTLRPLICRFYPFQLRMGKNRKHYFLHTEECPGIGKGEGLQKSFFENLFAEAQSSIGKTLIES